MTSRSFKLLPSALAAVLCAGLVACGGSSSETLTPPALSNFSYGPTSAAVLTGGTVSVLWSADVADTGADITQAVIIVKYAAGTTIATLTIPIQNPAGMTTGFLNGNIKFPTSAPASYVFTIQLTDSHGTVSNVLTGTFTVS